MPELLLLAGYLLLSAIMTSVLYCGSANYEAEPNILYDETAGYTGYPANM